MASMTGLSLMAPQQPKKDTIMMRIPAAKSTQMPFQKCLMSSSMTHSWKSSWNLIHAASAKIDAPISWDIKKRVQRFVKNVDFGIYTWKNFPVICKKDFKKVQGAGVIKVNEFTYPWHNVEEEDEVLKADDLILQAAFSFAERHLIVLFTWHFSKSPDV